MEESARELNEHERARHFGRERGLRERRSSMQAKEREAEWADSEKQLCEHCVCVKHLTAAAAAAEGSDSDCGSGSSQLSHMCN